MPNAPSAARLRHRARGSADPAPARPAARRRARTYSRVDGEPRAVARPQTAACAGSRPASARRPAPGCSRGTPASALRQTDRAGAASVRTKRPCRRPAASSDIAGSSPYGWRPTRSAGSGPCARTKSTKKRCAASTSARANGLLGLQHLVEVVAAGDRPQRRLQPRAARSSVRAAPSTFVNRSRWMPEQPRELRAVGAGGDPRRRDLDLEAAARRAAAEARARLGGVVGRRAGRDAARARACSDGRRAAPRAAPPPASGVSPRLDAEAPAAGRAATRRRSSAIRMPMPTCSASSKSTIQRMRGRARARRRGGLAGASAPGRPSSVSGIGAPASSSTRASAR